MIFRIPGGRFADVNKRHQHGTRARLRFADKMRWRMKREVTTLKERDTETSGTRKEKV